MSLSAIMGQAGLAGWAVAAMALFLAVFIALLLRLWHSSRRGGLEGAARLPLEDGVAAGTDAAKRKE